MSDTSNTRETCKLYIWQRNINRSLEGQLDLLHSLEANKYDIVAIQEPHVDFLGCTWANPYWSVIYPRQHLDNPKKTRFVMLINQSILTNNWEALNILSNNITGVWLHDALRSLCILNIYNNCGNNQSLEVVEDFMRERERAGRMEVRGQGRVGRLGVRGKGGENFIWLGDFNRHHPLWDKERNAYLFTKVALVKLQDYPILLGWKRCGVEIWIGKYEVHVWYL